MLENFQDRKKVVEAFMSLIENRHMKVFSELKMAGKITPEIEEDFREFLEVARDIFNRVGGDFSVDMVHQRLPNNKWTVLYYDYRAKNTGTAAINHTTVQ